MYTVYRIIYNIHVYCIQDIYHIPPLLFIALPSTLLYNKQVDNARYTYQVPGTANQSGTLHWLVENCK